MTRTTALAAGAVLVLGLGLLLVLLQRLSSPGDAVAGVAQLVTRRVVVADRLQRADAIFVFNGKIGVRAAHAAALYHGRLAPRILVTATGDGVWALRDTAYVSGSTSDHIAHEIERRRVPASAIEIISPGGSIVDTRDEAKALREHLAAHPMQRIIAVTTDYHTGRAKRLLRQELEGTGVTVLMAAAPDNTGIGPANWWRSREGIRTYGGEYLKLLLQAVHYDELRWGPGLAARE